MGIVTIIIVLLSLAGVFFVGRLLFRGFQTGRMVSFHYMGHITQWQDNRVAYVITTI